jgi:hypothetical protein
MDVNEDFEYHVPLVLPVGRLVDSDADDYSFSILSCKTRILRKH